MTAAGKIDVTLHRRIAVATSRLRLAREVGDTEAAEAANDELNDLLNEVPRPV